ncbi:uncharacterized protein LOC114518723 [Dendronephthya gigantea]|uniref:uncharacterized protein LOC114518723 n=1 Tax=Dendronephthya gigantea TaxID=151771 RepID=UPI00106A5DB1|nr:uncharacterized protein LOC114518723 [Dendronephthya gigantea]
MSLFQGATVDVECQRKSACSMYKQKQTKQGLCLSHKPQLTEDMQREKEHKDVKDFIYTLDEKMIRKLAIRSLRRGIGSMDYIDSLLIMEDDLDDEDENDSRMGEFGEPSEHVGPNVDEMHGSRDTAPSSLDPSHDSNSPAEVPDWCKCRQCRPMPQEVENKCCGQKKCIAQSSRFTKLCLDVLELCIRNTGDIRNDREDTSTRAFRKAAYRQFILARYGYLGKGNRRVCPSCVVLKIKERYPSVTGIYMGYRDR